MYTPGRGPDGAALFTAWKTFPTSTNSRKQLQFHSTEQQLQPSAIINVVYLVRNAEASLVEIESRDRHYKRILLLLRTHGCNVNVNSAFFHVILHRRFLRLQCFVKK